MMTIDDYLSTVKEFHARYNSFDDDTSLDQDYKKFCGETRNFGDNTQTLFMVEGGKISFHDGFLKVTEKRLPSGEFAVLFKGQGYFCSDQGDLVRQNLSFSLQSPVSWRAMNCKQIYVFGVDNS